METFVCLFNSISCTRVEIGSDAVQVSCLSISGRCNFVRGDCHGQSREDV